MPTRKAPAAPAKYAAGTNVSIEKSHIEVQKILKKYGAINTAYAELQDAASIVFTVRGRQYRIELQYPPLSNFQFDGHRVRRTAVQAQNLREQELRRLWRAFLMVIKAKLEAVESGILTFEQEFMAHTVLANNQTVSQWLEPQLANNSVFMLTEARTTRPEEIPDFIDAEVEH